MKIKQIIVRNLIVILSLFSTFGAELSIAFAQGTTFVYQGSLSDNGSPANGSYDLSFTLSDAITNGDVVGTVTNAAVGVTNGVFAVTLDFGSVFTGSNYWLGIAARTNGSDSFTVLAPRQPIFPVPYALYAPNAGTAAYSISAGMATSADVASVANVIGSVSATNVAQLYVPNTTVPATGTITIVSGFIVAANIVNGGGGYLAPPTVSVTDATGSNAVIVADVSADGIVTNLTVQTAGISYSSNAVLVIAAPPSNAIQIFGTINNFTGVNTFSGTLNANNLYLPATTIDSGIIYAGGSTLIHSYGSANFFAGSGSGNLTLSGNENTAVGYQALPRDTTGGGNTTIGYHAMYPNTTGSQNTGVGALALRFNTTGGGNTAVGWEAAGNITTGGNNTACGISALFSSQTSGDNTAVGAYSLYSDSSGYNNTAVGFNALNANTTGYNNVAVGYQSLQNNNSGYWNVAAGEWSLQNNTSGYDNTAIGHDALQHNLTGSHNIAYGVAAMQNLTNGQYNIAIGGGVSFTGSESNNIDIGNNGVVGENGNIRLGTPGVQNNTFIAGTLFGDGGGLTNIAVNAISGGLTVNIAVSIPGGGTKTLCFTNGILTAVQ